MWGWGVVTLVDCEVQPWRMRGESSAGFLIMSFRKQDGWGWLRSADHPPLLVSHRTSKVVSSLTWGHCYFWTFFETIFRCTFLFLSLKRNDLGINKTQQHKKTPCIYLVEIFLSMTRSLKHQWASTFWSYLCLMNGWTKGNSRLDQKTAHTH